MGWSDLPLEVATWIRAVDQARSKSAHEKARRQARGHHG